MGAPWQTPPAHGHGQPSGPAGGPARALPSPPSRTPRPTGPGVGQPQRAWPVMTKPPREHWWVRGRRIATLVTVGVLVVSGAASTLNTVRTWLRADPPAAVIPSSDTGFAGAAVVAATEYFAWDQADKRSRTAALSTVSASEKTIDGWGGAGRQRVDSVVAISVAQVDDRHAVVTVRARVIPYTKGAPGDPVQPSARAQPQSSAPSAPSTTAGARVDWMALPARWITAAVSVAAQGSRFVVTTTPALVGANASAAPAPIGANVASGDSALAAETREVVRKLLSAYGSGELEFVRAAGTEFLGLDGAAELGELTDWKVAALSHGQQQGTRVGTATVRWRLPGESTVSCAYRVELKQGDGRWLLASITTEIGEWT